MAAAPTVIIARYWNKPSRVGIIIFTHYVWSATIHAPDIIRELVHVLEQGESIETYTERINRNHEKDILWGRLKEVHMYKNPGPHSPVLFSCK